MVAEHYEAPKEEPISREKEEFLLILEEFRKFVYQTENSAEAWEVFEDIVALRASFLIDRVLTGLRMDFDKAFDLLKNFNSSLTERSATRTVANSPESLPDVRADKRQFLMRTKQWSKNGMKSRTFTNYICNCLIGRKIYNRAGLIILS